jgi:hypothetical protein
MCQPHDLEVGSCRRGQIPRRAEPKDRGRARRLYAAVLTKALGYGGADVGVVTYKSTKDWIAQNCFVPDWLKLAHWGDVVGTNSLQEVRALFVIGRPLASPEDVTRQAEALFGTYIPEREYKVLRKQGRIPIVPDAKGNNCILVDVHRHPDPMAERLRRQITEGGHHPGSRAGPSRAAGSGRAARHPSLNGRSGSRAGGGEPVLWSDAREGSGSDTEATRPVRLGRG